jgi:hypothetical protein
MGFDINKYNGHTFHENEMINKKIRALLVWFEYQVYENAFTPETEIDLLDSIINTMVSQEWYEVAVFFKNLKLTKLRNMFRK